uniref:Uncharacterized protein n=1 Tax=Myoviridae sp. ctj3P51 TaxID=2826687 RepID=A0A8S5NQG9_9CAUD|nr:MAG TPA: hypothetical protein [Myoviridae sp. ctj3P51]
MSAIILNLFKSISVSPLISTFIYNYSIFCSVCKPMN